jgi:transcription elongation factor Elf1
VINKVCCQEKKPFSIKVEADVMADPLWCGICGANLEPSDVPLPEALTIDLYRWISRYAAWINWDTDTLTKNGIELEDKHNEEGSVLTEKVKKELGSDFLVKFVPSSSARMYNRKFP